MSNVKDASDIEFATAVAAAAYAITLQEEEDLLNQKRANEQLTQPTAKIKSKRAESTDKPTNYSSISKWLSGKEAKDERRSGATSMKKPVTLEQNMLEESGPGGTLPGKAKETNILTKRTPTFSDKYLNDTGSSRFEHGQNQTGQLAPSIKPTASFFGEGNGGRRRTDSTKVQTKADAWERKKMDKIRERYERMKLAILEWENEKKSKAKRQLERKELNVERRRTRALREYRDEISKIDKVCGEAKAHAEERRRNKESETLEKARKMRSTGKVPNACFCC